MKKNEMIEIMRNAFHEGMSYKQKLLSGMEEDQAERLLSAMIEAGMRPPRLPEEICQAIMSVYYAGYSLNQWEEDALKDEKVVEKMKQRERIRNMTPEERKEVRNARAKRREGVLKAASAKADELFNRSNEDEE